MKILISRLHQTDENWVLNPDRPVALLEIGAAGPNWTFYDRAYEKKIIENFDKPVYFDERGALEKPEPYSASALCYLIGHFLPNIGLGASPVETPDP